MSAQPHQKLSPEEYLEIERRAETRSEFYQGEMFAMAGATLNHNLIVSALVRHLGNQIEDGPCRIIANDLRVRIDRENAYVYPDIVGFCAKPEFASEHFDILLNPELIVEVLSPSTEIYDRGLKFAMYETIPSLKEYILVSQDRVRVEHYTRQAPASWILNSFTQLEDRISLSSLGCGISLAQIYKQVTWNAA